MCGKAEQDGWFSVILFELRQSRLDLGPLDCRALTSNQQLSRGRSMTISRHEPLDVRTILRGGRHTTIFSIIEKLEPGAEFYIVNDHDPAPLRRQIEARYPGVFGWTYVVQGPDLWQVAIERTDAPADGCGGRGEENPCTCDS
jgi:uncharacterized protein (DUF2249 family)